MPDTPESDRDPRSVAEKARADLKANSELGLSPPESPVMERPSVTPETFGETGGFTDDTVPPDDAMTRAKE